MYGLHLFQQFTTSIWFKNQHTKTIKIWVVSSPSMKLFPMQTHSSVSDSSHTSTIRPDFSIGMICTDKLILILSWETKKSMVKQSYSIKLLSTEEDILLETTLLGWRKLRIHQDLEMVSLTILIVKPCWMHWTLIQQKCQLEVGLNVAVKIHTTIKKKLQYGFMKYWETSIRFYSTLEILMVRCQHMGQECGWSMI